MTSPADSSQPSRVARSSPSSTHRSPKKRSSLACNNCRHRKVKCSLIQTGTPCLNCKQGDLECTSTISKRTREYRLQSIRLAQTGERPTLLPRRHSTTPTASWSRSTPQDPSSVRRDCVQESPTYVSFNAHSDAEPTPRSGDASNSLGPNEDNLRGGRSLPSFIRATKRNIGPKDLAYLDSCGALHVPPPALRDQLLLAFVLYAYPFLPVVDLQDVCDAIEGHPECQISLILFQAIMFAGTAFVDLNTLLDAGFESRLAARAYFFRKIKASLHPPHRGKRQC